MQIDRRITNGLAWAGVVLVVGIPLADLVSAQVMGDGAGNRPAQVAMVAPIAPVPVALSERPVAAAAKASPIKTTPVVARVAAKPVAPVTQTGNVVDSYLKSGKALPGYITGAGTAPTAPQPPQAAAPAPSTAVTVPTALDMVDIAALGPAKIAPVPMPLSMRPEPVLIVQDGARPRSIQVGPSSNPRSSASVTYGDLQDWEAGPLSEFLAKRQAAGAVDSSYDPDGFYLDEGPNGAPRRDRLIGPTDDLFFPFAN